MKWLLKISYSWGDEEPYQEFNSFKEAWDTAKKDACNEAEIASIEANDETCEIGLTFEKEEVMRYHSLIVERESLSKELEIIAETDDKEIMGIKHKDYEIYGVQFHPESIYTSCGKKIIENFLKDVC